IGNLPCSRDCGRLYWKDPSAAFSVHRSGHQGLVFDLQEGLRRALGRRHAEVEPAPRTERPCQRAVEQLDDAARRPEGDVEGQALAAVSPGKCGDVVLEVPDIGPRGIDTLLRVADHAEMAGPGPGPAPPRP